MTEDLSKSLIIRSLKKGGTMMRIVGPWLPGSYLALAGTILESMPYEEAVEVGRRIWEFFGHEPAEAQPGAAPAQVQALTPEPANKGPEPVAIPPEQGARVPEQIGEIVKSEPFRYALEQAVDELPEKLTNFMLQTSALIGDVGIWPVFVLERVAQSHFRSELGASADAAEPEVAALVESALGHEAIELLRQGVEATRNNNPPGFELLGEGVGTFAIRLWEENPEFKWPNLEALTPGYLVASSELKSGEPEKAILWQDRASRDKRSTLLARLGQMGRSERESLTKAWDQACETLLGGAKADDVQTYKRLSQFRY